MQFVGNQLDKIFKILIVFTCGSLYSAIIGSQSQQFLSPNDCVDGPSTWYQGNHSFTKTGILCQRWDVNEPHIPNRTPADGGHHNYCRNPDGDISGLWCYTTDNTTRWEYCDIPKCPDDSEIFFTNYDLWAETSNLKSFYADVEIAHNLSTKDRPIRVEEVLPFHHFDHVWALAGDYHHKTLYYVERNLEHLEQFNLKTNESRILYEGIAGNIESIGYDWLSGNIYWSDSKYNWIIVSDPQHRYYTPVFKENSGFLYGLAVHPTKRKIFFSTYKPNESKLSVVDLSGKSRSILFQYPAVLDVTGIAIDYSEDRIYWTDYIGFGATLSSSSLDGKNLTQYFYQPKSFFWNIAVYKDFIYATDTAPNNQNFHAIWVVSKQHKKDVLHYRLKDLPRGITLFSGNFGDDVTGFGACNNPALSPCEHICIPQADMMRKCMCAMGYQSEADTRCVAKVIAGEFLLFSDDASRKMFQIPLNRSHKNEPTYSVMPGLEKEEVFLATAKPAKREVIWWSRKDSLLQKMNIDKRKPTNISHFVQASSMLADPCTDNLYVVDPWTQSIKVMNSSNGVVKTIFSANITNINSTDIKSITQDVLDKKIYWTDTNGGINRGKVMRMNYDGTNTQTVIDQLDRPHALTIDQTRRSLFVSEAFTGFIYEALLSSLDSASPVHSGMNIYNISSNISKSQYVNAVQVHHGFLYFSVKASTKFYRINLQLGAASIQSFGPSEFFSITSLSIFSNDRTDCSNYFCPTVDDCEGICLDAGRSNKCVCGDGAVMGPDKKCYKNSDLNEPPDSGDTCNGDLLYKIANCANSTRPSWQEPTWTDDHIPPNLISITKPNIPDRLTSGKHSFTYVATDNRGASSECTFTVTVEEVKCPPIPLSPPHLTIFNVTCGSRTGSTYKIKCKNNSEILYFNDKLLEFLTSECNDDGLWVPFSVEEQTMSCIVPPESTQMSKDTKSRLPHNLRNESRDGRGMRIVEKLTPLSTGSMIGISLGIVFAFFLIGFIILMKQRKGSHYLIKINFPRIWKRKDDVVHLDTI